MKLRGTICILLLLFIFKDVFSQKSKDSIFENVILIKESDVVKNGKNYLIDIPLNYEATNNPIFFNDSKVPPNALFFRTFHELEQFVLIAPDWDYYNSVAEEAIKLGGCIEPATTNKFYQITQKNGTIHVDSTKNLGDQPKLVFKKPKFDTEKFIKVYYLDEYNSSCCPRDPKWDNVESLNNFITFFKKKYNIKIMNNYKKITGKEGEHILYYTLSNLDKKGKLDFILKSNYQYIKNQHLKKIVTLPQIFVPKLVSKERLIKMNQ